MFDLAAALTPLPTTWGAGWAPSLHERSPGALAAIALYLLAFALALRAGVRAWRAPASGSGAAKESPAQRELSSRLWFAIALCLALLAVARLFDLGNLATSIGRLAAIHEGWYRRRRPYQFAGICALLIAAALLWSRLKSWINEASNSLRIALAATVLLGTFGAVRACSWHYLDRALSLQWQGVRLSWAIEGCCALVLAVAAARERVSPANPP